MPFSFAARQGLRSPFSWFFQRLTGLFLAYTLFVHIRVIHFGNNPHIDFATVTARLEESGLWKAYYIAFIPVVVFHGMNGLWTILTDYWTGIGKSKFALFVFWSLGALLSAFAFVSFSSFFQY
ncbi:MAG: hypothetical protein QME66_04010 [Candidatus Eisenbacteria bacterium]|nr:hypothetical protein [Candidatus Eisenbacteria bacterium]